MFVVAGSAQINLDNVEEFDIVDQSASLSQLQVRFTSGHTKVLCEGSAQQCAQYLGTLMASNVLKEYQKNKLLNR